MLKNDYVYIAVERPPDHLMRVRVVRFLDGDHFLAETATGHCHKCALSRVRRKASGRNAPTWILESTGEDATYYPSK
jgi:hypothetical protein